MNRVKSSFRFLSIVVLLLLLTVSISSAGPFDTTPWNDAETNPMDASIDLASMLQDRFDLSSSQWASSEYTRAYITFALVWNFSMDTHTRAKDSDLAYLETSYFYESNGEIFVFLRGINMLDGCGIILSYNPSTRESNYLIINKDYGTFAEMKESLENVYGHGAENDTSNIYEIAATFGFVGLEDYDYTPEEKEEFDSSHFAKEPIIDSCFSCGLIKYRDGGKWGYLDTKGKVAFKPQWDYVSSFDEGYAHVFIGSLNEKGNPAKGKHAVINTLGEYIIPYTECSSISVYHPLEEGISLSYKTGEYDWEYEYWSIDGKPLSGKRWNNAYDEIDNGLRCVCQNDKWGYVDSETEKTVIDFIYEDASTFSDGIATVATRSTNRKLSYFFIDEHGNMIIPNKGWDLAGSFEDNAKATYVFKGTTLYDGEIAEYGKYAIINRSGQFITDYIWDDVSIVSENLIAVSQMKDGTLKWGLIDYLGNTVSPLQWDYVSSFENGYAYVYNGKTTDSSYPDGGLYGFINDSGEIISDIQWEETGVFTKDGFAVVGRTAANKQKLYGIINNKGEEICPLIWEEVKAYPSTYNMFEHGLCPVKENGFYGYIDQDGDLAIDTEWEDAEIFVEGLAVAWDNGNWYIIDSDENIITSSKSI